MIPGFRHLSIMIREFDSYQRLIECIFCNHGSSCVFISLINQKFISQGVVLNSPQIM